MTATRAARRTLLATCLAFGVAFTVPLQASAEGPTLSAGCTTLHAAEGHTIVVDGGDLVITGDFAAGEQAVLTPTTTAAPAVSVSGGGGAWTLSASSGQSTRFDVPVAGTYTFTGASSPSASVSWRVTCGIPPTAMIGAPVGGGAYAVGDDVPTSFSCTGHTNPIGSCVDSNGDDDGVGALDTAGAGPHAYTLTATDSSGLRATTSISYSVARKEQSLAFTSIAPDGSADWFFGDLSDLTGGLGYVAEARATSGLPVTYSLDPASNGICRIAGILEDNPILGSGAGIQFLGAGTCTIHADQPGDEEYLPATRVSQSFEIAKVSTATTAARAGKGVLGLTPSTFSATVYVPVYAGAGGWSSEGYPGQQVIFSVAGKPVCAAVTNVSGVATCKATIGLANWLNQTSYTATYAGDTNYKGSTATGKLG